MNNIKLRGKEKYKGEFFGIPRKLCKELSKERCKYEGVILPVSTVQRRTIRMDYSINHE